MNLKKGDNVTIITGKDRGKSASIINVFPKRNKVIVENLNLRKKHIKPRKQGEKGQTINIAVPLDVSNVVIVCKNCGKKTRIGYKILKDKNKVRICKKCKEEV